MTDKPEVNVQAMMAELVVLRDQRASFLDQITNLQTVNRIMSDNLASNKQRIEELEKLLAEQAEDDQGKE